MSGFTVNLDLTAYFDDLRKFSSVYVDLSKCNNVGDLVKHIKFVFKLEDNICLVNNKFLLPSKENVQILLSCDTIKVKKCDFFDQQIHKNKEATVGCSQNALNLIQLERTIDLSCKPKQRLRLNSSQCSNKPEALSTPFVESYKTHLHQEWLLTSASDEASPVLKCRKSKKQQDVKSKALGVNSRDENCLDILDMSVKKAQKQNYENSFLASEGCEMFCKNKKRKLNSSKKEQGSSIDSQENPTGFWNPSKYTDFMEDSPSVESLTQGSFTFDEIKQKKRKKHKERNVSRNAEEIESCQTHKEFEENAHNSTFNDQNPQKQKHKKKRKSVNPLETTVNQFSSQHSCTLDPDVRDDEEFYDLLQNNHPTKRDIRTTSKSLLEERKTLCKNKIDGLLNNIDKSELKPIDSSNSKSQVSNKDSNESGGDEHKDEDGNQITYGDSFHTGDQSIPSNLESLDTNPKRKRVRKHNKKKKREKRQYMSAVGPVLNNLSREEVKSSPMPSETAKHVFFTDDDLTGEHNIPDIPAMRLETELDSQSTHDPSKSNNINSFHGQEAPSNRLASWQEKLLKLSTDSKPVVFHRKSSTENLNVMSKTQNGSSMPNLLCNTNTNINTKADTPTSCEHNASIAKETSTEVLTICNGKMSNGNGVDGNISLEGTNNKTLDRPTSNAIANDIKNIVLTNYPVIDKVRDGDLVIFKILKLHENGEPGVSEVVLGKIIDPTCFPDTLSIQIVQGCDEFDPLNYPDFGDKEFVIKLRWTDLIEPRLFYP